MMMQSKLFLKLDLQSIGLRWMYKCNTQDTRQKKRLILFVVKFSFFHFYTSDLATLNEMNLDLIDFLAFESQGRVWLQVSKTTSFKLNAFHVRTPVH